MNHRSTNPIVLRRRIAREIRGLRQQAGLSLDAVSERTAVTKSTLSRMEKGQTAPKVPILRLLLQTYEAPSDKWEELEQLAREANRRGWWSQQFGGVDVPDWMSTYVGLESEAEELRIFEQIMPGLLQTAEYARAIITPWVLSRNPENENSEDIEGRVQIRISRQERLGAGLSVHVVLDEGALHRVVGNWAIMARQMERLAELATRPGVTIQVLSLAHPATLVIGSPFTILSFANKDPDVVHIEALEIGYYIEDSYQVGRFRLVYERLREAALVPAESVALFTKLATRYAQGE